MVAMTLSQAALKLAPLSGLKIASPAGPKTFTFRYGIPGFHEHREWGFEIDDDLRPFVVMRSALEPDISFFCIDPFIIKPDYAITINDMNAGMIDLEHAEDACLLSLVTVGTNIEETTANLMCPLVINVRNLMGMQMIFEHQEPLLKVSIWQALESNMPVSKVG